jgi:hydroxyacylglutathione hydrolase
MLRKITIITLPLPFRLGSVNCYLIETEAGHVLIDTGCSNRRANLERELETAGCKPGSLKLVVLTHGDFDHAGNAAYLRRKYGAEIAMHYDDAGMVERGNMFWNRRKSNVLIRMIVPILLRFGKSERLKPDLCLEDGDDLSEYGLDAKVVHIPGHSKGSIGVVTASADLFCGDLLIDGEKPALNSIIDDLAAATASTERLKGLGIEAVYPGHGKPFSMARLMRNNL